MGTQAQKRSGYGMLRIDDPDPLIQTQVPIGFVYSVAFSPVAGFPYNYWVAASGFYGDIVMYRTSDMPQRFVIPRPRRSIEPRPSPFPRMAAWWPPLQLRGFSSGRSLRSVTCDHR